MPKRIQMTRRKPWRNDNPDAVIVARPSPFGNYAGAGKADYDRWIAEMSNRDRVRFSGKVLKLRGKDLACWCSLDKPCHADTLLELANGKTSSNSDAVGQSDGRITENLQDTEIMG